MNRRALKELVFDTFIQNVYYVICLRIQKTSTGTIDVHVEDFVAVKSAKYTEKPLIGQITSQGKTNITIDWYIGTYSGTWKPWKGREQGKTVTYTDIIEQTDILQKVTFIIYKSHEATNINSNRTKKKILTDTIAGATNIYIRLLTHWSIDPLRVYTNCDYKIDP